MTAAWPTTSLPSSPPRRRLGPRLGLVLLIALVAGGLYVWRCHISTYHLATVEPGVLYRDGVQSPCQFETAVRKVQPKTVVSLIDENEEVDENKKQFASEKEYLQKKGIKLERIPVKLGGWPKKQDVERFFAVVNDPQNQPVIVHCAQGVRRTGMMAAAYQIKQLGYDKERAKESILRFGHSDRTANDVKRFIDGYDPATGAVPENLMPTNE
jgi:protein tyrosine phosphatase (PTP) superfamily phosphohydrolase (DUF442 family)